MAAAETQATGNPVSLVFNGDFNWFNVEATAFRQLNDRVLRHPVVLGNVEWELSDPDPEAGCGCAYPAEVDQALVDRSNRIIQRLRDTARDFPELCQHLRQQPRYRCYTLDGRQVLVLHGDPEALAGWGLSRDTLAAPGHQPQLHQWFAASGADVIAATHTCQPALWRTCLGDSDRVIINNGAAGMGNLPGDPRGLITRIAVQGRHPEALAGTDCGGLRVELIPVPFDSPAWHQLFSHWWPPGSDAEVSYGERIQRGATLHPARAEGQTGLLF